MNIKEAATQAGMNVSLWDYGAGSIVFTMGTEGLARGALERFAQIIRNQVLEEAAKVCDPEPSITNEAYTVLNIKAAMRRYAAAIRALKGAKE